MPSSAVRRLCHLRQHHRVSHADADLQSEAVRFHIGLEKPVVHHFFPL
nr:MFS transporter [Polaromonas jejuensis]